MPFPSPDNFVDVLIIGAGPAGLMCANALVHAGISVRIVDKKYVPRFCNNCRATIAWYRDVPVAVGHADGIHPRTIEILQVGCAPPLDAFFLTFVL